MPVCYSRALRGSEINYPAVEKEASSIIEALKKLRPLIYNSLVVFTDKALCWLFERADDRNARISLSLQEAKAEVKYIKGFKITRNWGILP